MDIIILFLLLFIGLTIWRGAPRWLVLATRQLAARPAFAVVQVSALAVVSWMPTC